MASTLWSQQHGWCWATFILCLELNFQLTIESTLVKQLLTFAFKRGWKESSLLYSRLIKVVFVNVVGALWSRWRGACSELQTLKTNFGYGFWILLFILSIAVWHQAYRKGQRLLKCSLAKSRICLMFEFLGASPTGSLNCIKTSCNQKPPKDFLLVTRLYQMPTFSLMPKEAKPQHLWMCHSRNILFCKNLFIKKIFQAKVFQSKAAVKIWLTKTWLLLSPELTKFWFLLSSLSVERTSKCQNLTQCF